MSSPPPTSAIPLVSLSPTFSTSQTNVIPSLQEEPMLGDMEETGILREYKYPSPHPHGLHEDVRILGKHIWKFRIKKLLGEGAFSRVFLAENLEEGGHVAVKVINKERMYQDLRVKSRGELFDFVKHIHNNLHQVLVPSSIDEILIKRLALEIIQVVSWLHQINIVHRDLKLENILVYFDEKTGEPHIKITDFGLARVMDPIKPILTTRCGSEEYAAPEIVQSLGYDGRLTDTWSIGIIIYALLVGYLPFTYDPHKGEKISHLFHRIVMAQVKWPVDDNISLEAKEVVQKILVRHPDKRVRLDQVEQLPWFDPV
ncbi:kinase-like domain-containing protein [Gilbertella persicaria]|uniref:kinase-like domain-containing protein n=1 Tax=Gilbertella persicaria TaxID=101096 RepID=UPI00222018BC|nr:kinase-like domain-containing protein [Gilbertella persicaria]KAI8063382.1 kinase-like domain-containing protein [Gilbertella persicaria]